MTTLTDLITPDLRDMITMAVLLHQDVHEGGFMDCEDVQCADMRTDLTGLIDAEGIIDAVRALAVVS